MHLSRCIETIAWSDLCETGTNGSIDVSALRAWLMCLTWGSRAAKKSSFKPTRRCEREKKTHRQALSIRIPRKFAEVDDSCEMAASLKGYCARLPLKQLTWNCVHTARYVARIDIGWHKRWRQTERVTRNLTKEERKHACAARFSLPLFWKRAPCTLPSYQDKPLLILALSRKCHILTETLIRSGDFKCVRRFFYTSSSDVIIQELHHYGS